MFGWLLTIVMDEAFKFGWDREDNNWDWELSPDPFDWVFDCDKEEDPYLVMLDDFKEDFLWIMDVARPRAKGKRELLNLESSVNYGIASTSSRRRKAKIIVSVFCVGVFGLWALCWCVCLRVFGWFFWVFLG
jgi:hypothetical protein